MRRVVTTWPEGAEYAPRFLESYVKHWNTELYVYYEGRRPDFEHKLVRYYPLDDDGDRRAFTERNKGRQSPASDAGNAYRWDWQRFCHKVFALTNPRNTEGVDWLIWLDADVITMDAVDEAFLDLVCKGDVSYVGRDGFTHPDCAFVAYRISGTGGGETTLRHLRWHYTSDEIFKLAEWHDSFVFQHCLIPAAGNWVNLSPNIPGMQVFDDCILGTKMRHLKGKARKLGLTPQIPGYSSQKEMAVPASGMRPIEIKTKNCVAHPYIQANIHYNLTLLPNNWVVPCKPHSGVITFCSGGPSLEKYFDKIKENREKGHRIAVVKTAHDRMIEAGIIPDFCVLLDPRSHVQDFIENPHPDVIYLVASMVHPTTLDKLLEKKAKVLGYHAHVGAEEDKVLKARKQNAMLIGGGCSAAMRGISVFYTMGFCEFHLYGYDLCFAEKPWEGEKPPVKADGTPQYLEVEACGRKFYTDPEKIAQAQDFEKMMREDQRIEVHAYGDGIVPHLWATLYHPRPSYEELIGAVAPSGITEPRP